MRIRIRFHIGLAVAYSLATLVLISGIIWYLFQSASALAVDTAKQAMTQAAEDVEISFDSLFRPVSRAVQSTAYLSQSDKLDFDTDEGAQFLLRQMRAKPEVASLYIAFSETGRFRQVARIGGGSGSGAASGGFIYREMDSAPGVLMERNFADWAHLYRAEIKTDRFDARERPWYKGAVESGQLTLSDPYNFASSGKPGLTISEMAVAPGGGVQAVVAADITLERLGDYLGRKRVGQNGRTFVIDENGELIVVSHKDTLNTTGHDAIRRQSVDMAIRHYLDTGETRFTLTESRPVMAAFRPFPEEFGKPWTVGVLADRRELVGGIRQSTGRSIVVSVIYTLIAIGVMVWLSRRITLPLRRIIEETERIRDFRLDGAFNLRSPIVEIDDLSRSVSNMKTGLRGFKAFVPVELVQSILSSGKAVRIGGEIREVTLMFSDIEGFSAKSETLPASVVFSDLSTYFGVISDRVQAHNGTVDKFIGDAVMGLWNAPLEDPDHTIKACRAVLSCAHSTAALKPEDGTQQSLFPLKTRFGLHVGEVIVGNVGSDRRMQYTALGKDVNLASRLEGLNKQYGTNILVSEQVAERAGDGFFLRLVDLAVPVGTSRPVRLFELLGEKGGEGEPDKDRALAAFCAGWQDAMALYEKRDWSAAAAAFSAISTRHPEDSLAGIYVARCQGFKEAPPPSDWDGVHLHQVK